MKIFDCRENFIFAGFCCCRFRLLYTVFTHVILALFFPENQREVWGCDNYAGKIFRQMFRSVKCKDEWVQDQGCQVRNCKYNEYITFKRNLPSL